MDQFTSFRALFINWANACGFLSLVTEDFFIRVKYLGLRYFMEDYKNIIPSIDPQSMNQLIVLSLEKCLKIKYLIDITINIGSSVVCFKIKLYSPPLFT